MFGWYHTSHFCPCHSVCDNINDSPSLQGHSNLLEVCHHHHISHVAVSTATGAHRNSQLWLASTAGLSETRMLLCVRDNQMPPSSGLCSGQGPRVSRQAGEALLKRLTVIYVRSLSGDKELAKQNCLCLLFPSSNDRWTVSDKIPWRISQMAGTTGGKLARQIGEHVCNGDLIKREQVEGLNIKQK